MNNRFDELVTTVTNEATEHEPAQQQGNVVAIKKPSAAATRPKKKESLDRVGVGETSISLTRPVVPMTVRFRPDVAEKLKRRVFENRLAGSSPQTIQDAVNDAVSVWLRPC